MPYGASPRRIRSKQVGKGWLLALGAVTGLVGALAPWVPHRAAGLRFSAFDLFALTRLLPGVASGEVRMFREAFLLPLLGWAALVALLPGLTGRISSPVRWLCPLLGAGIALTALPPYPAIVAATDDPLLRGQFLLSVGVFLLAVLSPLASLAPYRVLQTAAVVLALGGVLPGLLTLARVRPVLSALYGQPVGIGWGVAASILAAVLEVVGALLPNE